MRICPITARRSLLTVGLACVALSSPAQVPEDVRGNLGRNATVIAGSFIYAGATGTIRGTRETTEDIQATRAIRLLAHALCDVAPAAGQVLETSITGLVLVSSTMRAREVEVVMRAPVQKPECKVLTAIQASPITGTGVPESRSPNVDLRLTNPGYARSKDITVRILGAEY
jgi:hypothetical protein